MISKRQRSALRHSNFHPEAVASVARAACADGDLGKAATLYRSIVEKHARSSAAAEALNFLMVHKPPTASAVDAVDRRWAMPPPRTSRRRNSRATFFK